MKVVVTDRRFAEKDPYTEPVRAAGGELVYAHRQSESDVVEACRDATVILTFRAPITREVIEAAEAARLIVRNGTGHDNVDVTAATECGVPVSNVPNYCIRKSPATRSP